MKSKKLILAIAIFGGMLFTAQATNIIDLDGQAKTEIKKKKLKLKDKLISHTRELARREKYNSHEYIKRALSMTA